MTTNKSNVTALKYLTFLPLFIVLFAVNSYGQKRKTRNIILITIDGFRWQELFTGADPVMVSGGRYNSMAREWRREQYWRDEVNERRESLMPFFWKVFAGKSQVYGNRLHGNLVNVKNPYWISYPGYNEILTGYADPACDGNSLPSNPNKTFLDFINDLNEYKGKVAVSSVWDFARYFLNQKGSQIPMRLGYESYNGWKVKDEEQLNRMQKWLPTPWGPNENLDGTNYLFAKKYILEKHPRVMYISFGNTDSWAHAGQYDFYLNAAHSFDSILEDLWNTLESDDFYKGKTTIFITTDHGRGTGNKWTGHGSYQSPEYGGGTAYEGSDQIWFAVSGPDTEPLGEIKTGGQYYQDQFAKTICNFLGIDFQNGLPVGEPIQEVDKTLSK